MHRPWRFAFTSFPLKTQEERNPFVHHVNEPVKSHKLIPQVEWTLSRTLCSMIRPLTVEYARLIINTRQVVLNAYGSSILLR